LTVDSRTVKIAREVFCLYNTVRVYRVVLHLVIDEKYSDFTLLGNSGPIWLSKQYVVV